MLPFLVTGAAGFAGAYLIVALFIFPKQLVSDDTNVPSVIGMTYDEASGRLDREGFRVSTGEQRYHASAPQGTVLSQMPPSGSREPRGTTISLDLSRGPRFGEVPSLVGLPQPEAERMLNEAGLDRGIVTEQASAEPRGQVLSSTPEAGNRVALPASVAMTVSAGPGAVEVPDVVGQSLSEARSLLRQLGFRVRINSDSLSTMPSGMVVSQRPGPGARAPSGALVTIAVSAGTAGDL
ncbi:MAG TPA: PASTA domain-containing protein [Gemmatimonadaceae bacterium]|nr:PASTA domain-containing protein [Gemmatimonadaceae bacterium]